MTESEVEAQVGLPGGVGEEKRAGGIDGDGIYIAQAVTAIFLLVEMDSVEL